MKKLIICISILISGIDCLASNRGNWLGNDNDGFFLGILIVILLIVIATIFNFALCIHNIKRKNPRIRYLTYGLLIPSTFIAVISFSTVPIIGFISCLFILLELIFIYLSYPSKDSTSNQSLI